MPLPTGHSVPQTEQPRSPRETLPTMYDLPSEFPEEPGFPDGFHDLQPQLLSRTLHLQNYTAEKTASPAPTSTFTTMFIIPSGINAPTGFWP